MYICMCTYIYIYIYRKLGEYTTHAMSKIIKYHTYIHRLIYIHMLIYIYVQATAASRMHFGSRFGFTAIVLLLLLWAEHSEAQTVGTNAVFMYMHEYELEG